MSPIKKNKSSFAQKKSHSKKRVNEDSEKENNANDSLTDLLKKKWKVFRVSPLYNFSRNRLGFYEKKLNEELNSKKGPPVICKSKFTLNKNVRVNEQYPETLKVEVMKGESQSIYSAQFISTTTIKDVADGHIFFSILLVEAKENEIHGVHSALCKIFDCDIQPVTLSFFALITFFVKLLETQRLGDATQEEILMEFKVPECDNKDKIKITLILQDTAVVYALVKKNLEEKYQNIPAMETIWKFYSKVLNHIYHVYKMNLMAAELQSMIFPDATMTTDGQVKFSTREAALNTLCVLSKFTPLDSVVSM